MPARLEPAMDILSGIDPDCLPDSVREMAEVIGLDAALLVVRCYGGRRLWLPREMSADHHLAQAIGLAAARRLSAHYRLECLLIPTCKGALRALRNQQISQRYQAGEKAAALAREFGLHERMIWQIVAGQRPPRQASPATPPKEGN